MNKCIGPCLPHCFNKDQILYFLTFLLVSQEKLFFHQNIEVLKPLCERRDSLQKKRRIHNFF